VEQVTPKFERHPVRTYIREGATIRCFAIEGQSGCFTKPVFQLSTSPLFVIQAPSEEAAETLMEDMYYGEYTGA
jgi:hypothetical protein